MEQKKPDESKSRRISNCPPPIRPVGGSGLAPYRPKPTRIPPNPPSYFPSDLWPRTVVILAKAREMFPDETKALELCKYVISKMTPLFCEAVTTGEIGAGAVLSEGHGGMSDVLHSLLVYSDYHSSDRFRLETEARGTHEWLELAQSISEAIPTGVVEKISTTKASSEPKCRRGYRAELRTWMKQTDIENLEQAARKLGVGITALKSIMSSKGRLRCGTQTLEEVLTKIGIKSG